MNLRELVAVLGHELRTPLAAILGYQELLVDGIYGEVEDKQREPLDRIQHSASQLLHLIDGLQELVDHGTAANDERVSISPAEIVDQITASAKPYATGRHVKLDTSGAADHELHGVPLGRFLRAADLALVAAIQVSPGAVLSLSVAEHDHHIALTITNTALSILDDPNQVTFGHGAKESTHKLSASRLRLSMACASARVAQGRLALIPDGDKVTLDLRIPLQQPD